MASFHCSTKSGDKGKGGPHSDYINREGKYAAIENDREKYKKYEDLVCKESGNMPEWARDNPKDFWEAADEFERSNGRAYTEIEIALPNELTQEQQKALVEEFAKQQFGNENAYSYAIHDKPATLNPRKKNTHAHLMFSERKNDGIERDREQYFKRGNTKNPERGGAMKDREKWHPKEKPLEIAKDWAEIQNKYLERYRHEVRVDHRSLEDQKISAIESGDIEKAEKLNRTPEPHLGPKVAGELVREVTAEMAKGQTKEEKAELKTQYYEKETTNRKVELSQLARSYCKARDELAKEKKADEIEKIQKRLPIKTIEPEAARKHAERAYWKKIEKELAQDKTKFEKDKINFEKVKSAVDNWTRNSDGLTTKDLTEISRVKEWGEQLQLKERQVERRQTEFDQKVRPADYDEKINKTTENILKRDSERVEKLCELAEQAKPGQKLTTQDLKYIVDLAIQTQQPVRDQLVKEKEEIQKKVIKPETAQAAAISVYTKGENKRLAEEKKAILAERERHGKTQAEQMALRERVKEFNRQAKTLSEKVNSPEGKAKIKEFSDRLEKRNEPIRKQLAEIKEKIKPLDKDLSDLKGLSQKIQQTDRDQKFEKKVHGIKLPKLSPKTIIRNIANLNKYLQVPELGATHAAPTPKGHTQARIGDDEDPAKKRGQGLEI